MSQLPLIEAHSAFVKQSRFFHEKLVETAMNNLEEDRDKYDILLEVEKLLQTTIRNECLIGDLKGIVQPLQDHIGTDNEDDIKVEDVRTEVDSLIQSYTEEDTLDQLYQDDADMKKLKDLITQLSADDDDATANAVEFEDEDIKATLQDLNLIDPITKKLMVNPVRHTVCGHVYDKEPLLQMITKKGKRKGFRCPTMGCAYRKPINPNDLREAVDYKMEIMRRKQAGTLTSQA